jgi:hypothetical protein
MTSASDKGGGWIAADHKHAVGELLLDLNTLLEEEYEVTRRGLTSPSENQSFFAALFRLGFYSHADHFGSGLARNHMILTDGLRAVSEKFPGEAFDFRSCFRDAFSFSYEHMFALAMALVSHYFDIAGVS